ncbi:unnamed protein product [Phytophthora fragariaefolia]|uniref:Unnamed protein product n=1 Tax=Phytophthora fragariaefolia TaxID=1490495 RepID=A0A9W7CZT1_9STRA|nr:unnamed protein product [Phytophthora fragariaefolia]
MMWPFVPTVPHRRKYEIFFAATRSQLRTERMTNGRFLGFSIGDLLHVQDLSANIGNSGASRDRKAEVMTEPSSSASADGENSVAASDLDDALSYFLLTPDLDNARVTPERSGGGFSMSGNGSRASSDVVTPGPSFWPANAQAVQLSSSSGAKPKKKRRRDRNRPIHEVHRLQTQVQDLERQLKALKPSTSPGADELKVLKDKNAALKEKLKKGLENTAKVEKLLQTQADKLLQALPKSLAVTWTSVCQ